MEGTGDGDSGGVLGVGAGGREDLKPCLLRVLYKMLLMLLIFLTHAGGTSSPCEKVELCISTWKQNLWGFLGPGTTLWGLPFPRRAGDGGWRPSVLQRAVGQPAHMRWTGGKSPPPKLAQAGELMTGRGINECEMKKNPI